MSSKAFFVAAVLPVLVLIGAGFGLSVALRHTHGLLRASLAASGPVKDDGSAVGAPTGADPAPVAAASADVRQKPALSTRGRHIYTATGRRWRPRGADLLRAQTCASHQARPDEKALMAEADALLAQGVNLVRVPLEPWTQAGAHSHEADVQALEALVDHVLARPGVAVLLGATQVAGAASDPDDLPRQRAFWQEVVDLFADRPWVIFDLSRSQYGGRMPAQDAQVVAATDALLGTIRARERALGVAPHLVAVQGRAGTGRGHQLDYDQGGPLQAARAGNVVWVGRRPGYVLRRPGALYVSPVRRRPA